MPAKTEEKDKHLELLSDVIKSLILDEKILVSSSVSKQDLSCLSNFFILELFILISFKLSKMKILFLSFLFIIIIISFINSFLFNSMKKIYLLNKKQVYNFKKKNVFFCI